MKFPKLLKEYKKDLFTCYLIIILINIINDSHKENIIFKNIKVFNEKELKALDDLVLINN